MWNSEMPIGLSLIPADMVIEDKITGNKSVVGIRNSLELENFPGECNLSLLISLTGGQGEYSCQIQVTDNEDKERIYTAGGTIRFANHNQVIDLVVQMKGLKFATPDIYWIKLLVDDIPLMMRPLVVGIR